MASPIRCPFRPNPRRDRSVRTRDRARFPQCPGRVRDPQFRRISVGHHASTLPPAGVRSAALSIRLNASSRNNSAMALDRDRAVRRIERQRNALRLRRRNGRFERLAGDVTDRGANDSIAPLSLRARKTDSPGAKFARQPRQCRPSPRASGPGPIAVRPVLPAIRYRPAVYAVGARALAMKRRCASPARPARSSMSLNAYQRHHFLRLAVGVQRPHVLGLLGR